MSAGLTEEDRALAISLLKTRLTARELREGVDRNVETLVATTERVKGLYRSTIPTDQLAAFLVDSRGVELLEGPGHARDLRCALASTLDETALGVLYAYQPGVAAAWSRRAKISAIAGRKWSPGKTWARHFVKTIGLPPAFAGVVGLSDGPHMEEIEPYIPLPELHDYQKELMRQLLQVLDAPRRADRVLLSLPTGAGKTRTAVDALIHWWADGDLDRGYILWIAQSDELCEQAVEAFREAWVDRGWKSSERRSLRLYRFWGSRPVPDSGGIVVAGIDQLYAAMNSTSASTTAKFEALVDATRAIVLDEAHHAIADEYLSTVRKFGIGFRDPEESPIPFIGLTATPYRGTGVEENKRLAQYFGRNLLIPSGMADPLGELRVRGILSEAHHTVITTRRIFELSPSEERDVERFKQFPASLLKRVGDDAARNRLLLEQLLALPPETPTLFFGCSVQHAEAMAVLLRRNGRRAATVSAKTRRATRRYLVEEFRGGGLQVLCNYGVLTTGFDAPKVEAIMIARPTMSPVVYEQMIGRGMRGPVNGGTAECRVIDLVDNIVRFQGQMAYTRFSEYWQ